MLFRGHAIPRKSSSESLPTPELPGKAPPSEEAYGLGEGDRKPIWQEVMHKARLRLCRTLMDWTFDPAQGYCPKASPSPTLAEDYSATSALAMFTPSGQYSYHLEIIEDLDDGRVHDEDGPKLGPYDDMPLAGIRESIPIYQISKIFYTDTGRLLNIRDTGDGDSSPVLLLKRDVDAKTPDRLREEWLEGSDGSQSGTEEGDDIPLNDQSSVDRQLLKETEAFEASVGNHTENATSYLPKHVDPEWMALEVYMEDDEAEDSEDGEELCEDSSDDTPRKRVTKPNRGPPNHRSSVDSDLLGQIRRISIQPSPSYTVSQPSPEGIGQAGADASGSTAAKSPFGSVITSLSLLEMLIRLTSLQEFQQTPHLSIPDHILTFFLEETSTTGLQQGEAQWALRNEAKRRVGFDPYADTPNK